jgi:hypothetical protein
MMKRAFVLALAMSVVASQAVQFNLHNTGVDDSGAQLAGGANDLHWNVAGIGSASVLSPANTWGQWPFPSDAMWIAPYDLWQVPYGTYTFTQTFDLTGLDPATAKISGQWAADQFGTISLNGNVIASLGDGNWTQLNSFEATSHFVPGVNALSIEVLFPDGGDGLLVSGIQGTAEPVPEPISALVLITGLAALARRRR